MMLCIPPLLFNSDFKHTFLCILPRFGRKPIIITTIIAEGISNFVISQLTTIEPILFLRVLASWGKGGTYISCAAFGKASIFH